MRFGPWELTDLGNGRGTLEWRDEMDIQVLNEFCGSTHESFKTPFYRNDYTYSTDGFVCIRIKGEYAEENKSAPLADEIDEWDSLKRPTPDWRLKASKMQEIMKQFPQCRKCNPHAVTTTCSNCNGDGWVTTEDEFGVYERECKICEGEGHISPYNTRDCPYCNGSRLDYTWQWQIGTKFFNFQLLLKLTDKVGDLELFCWPAWSSKKQHPALAFRFDGGEGLIMPMKPKESELPINMQEIKFRAWDKIAKVMLSWKNLDEMDSDGVIYLFNICKGECEHLELEQYTGLKDANGVEIYEGDILEARKGAFRDRVTVFWNNGMFTIGSSPLCDLCLSQYEVIGNIHEGKEDK